MIREISQFFKLRLPMLLTYNRVRQYDKSFLTNCLIICHLFNSCGRWAISYCTNHPGKDAVGACCQCGHLVCKACYTELNEKVYCTTCANKLFTLKTPEPSKPPSQDTAAKSKPIESAPKIPEPVQPPPPKPTMQQAEPPQVKPIEAPAPVPIAQVKPVIQEKPVAEQVKAAEAVKPEPAVAPPVSNPLKPNQLRSQRQEAVKQATSGGWRRCF